MSLADGLVDLVAAFTELPEHLGADAVLLQEGRRALGGLDVEAQVVEPADERKSVLLVLVGDGGEDRPVGLDVHAGGLQGLVQGAVQGVVVADGFARGLHLRGEVSVDPLDLSEGEGRRLDEVALALREIDLRDALFLQGVAQHHPRGDLGHRDARALGDERDGAGRPRIDLDHVHVLVAVHDELDVEQAHDADGFAQFHRIVDDLLLDLRTQAKGRIDADGVAGVDAGTLHVFHDGRDEDVRPVADGIDLGLLAHDILVHQDRGVLVDFHCIMEIVTERVLVAHDHHRAASEHEARTHEDRVADVLGRLHAVLHVRDGMGLGLADTGLAHDLLEELAVLGVVDGLEAGADERDAELGEGTGEVDGRLAAQGDDDSVRLLEPDDVHHVLRGERLEIELVGDGIVRRNGFGVVVDDDGLVAGLADGPDGMDRGVVEFHALADADRTGTQHEDLLAVARDGLVLLLVRGVEVGNIGVVLGGAGVDHLIDRDDAVLEAEADDVGLALPPELPDELVAEAHALGLAEDLHVARSSLDAALHPDDVVDLLEEEPVDLRAVVDAGEVDPQAQELRNRMDAVVGRGGDVLQEFLLGPVVELLLVDVAAAAFQGAHRLEDALLEGASDAHHLARRLHLGAELVGGLAELVEGEAGHLGDHVVDGRFAAGGSAGHGDFVQGEAHGDLRRHTGDWEAAGLGGEGGGPGHARIDLDDIVLEGQRIQGELDVASAFDLEGADEFQGAVPEHLVFFVGEGEGGGHDHRVARVDAHRVDVLHRADGDGGVIGVAHHLELDLLVALDALFHKHFADWGEGEGVPHHVAELLLVVGETAARATQGEGRTQDHRIADALRRGHGFLDAVGDFGGDDRLVDREAQLLEKFAVFRLFDALEGGSQDLHAAFLQDAFLGELDGEVQAGLAAEAGHEGVRTLVADDLGDVFQGEGLHVHLVGHLGVRHDGRGVGVHEDDLVALFLEGDASLRTGVVEFRGLADHDRTGADHEHFPDIFSPRHSSGPPSFR